MKPTWEADGVKLYHADCLDVLPTLQGVDAVITDPPYGMGKSDWDGSIPAWLLQSPKVPTAAFCGVIGMRDYAVPDWVGAWVRQGSTQRNGRFQGFNNWEPILFYHIKKLENDVIACPNFHAEFDHPCVKPERLMVRLVEIMPSGVVLDPFMGSGTTGIACIRTGRKFIGIEKDARHFETARARIERELAQGVLPFDGKKAEIEQMTIT